MNFGVYTFDDPSNEPQIFQKQQRLIERLAIKSEIETGGAKKRSIAGAGHLIVFEKAQAVAAKLSNPN